MDKSPTYEEYKKWIQSLGVKTQLEFRSLDKIKFPKDYPKNPENYYTKVGTWKGWNDLLGTKSHLLENPPAYEEYKKWIQSLGVKTQLEFRSLDKIKFPKDYPKNPVNYYKRQGTWKGWNDLFGTESHLLENPPAYEEYKKWVRKVGLKTRSEFKNYPKSKFPKNYPKAPVNYYKRQGTWKGWNELFGTEEFFLKDAPSYDEYKKWVQSLDVKTQSEFRNYPKSKFPKNYPKAPREYYKRQGTWKGWNDLFGTESIYLQNPPTFDEYKKWIRKVGVKTQLEFKNLDRTEFPKGYPKNPDSYYGKLGAWKGWNDLFGTEEFFLKDAPSYDEYKKWIRQENIKSKTEFEKFDKSKFPKNYPKAPGEYYKRQGTWKGWNDLFGTEEFFLKNPPAYEEYKKWIQSLGVKTQLEFRSLDKIKFPKDYPKNPVNYYKRQGTWKGWNDLFGTESIYLQNPPTYDEYKKWIAKIGIKTQKELNDYPKSKFPKGFPRQPDAYYEKQGTWISHYDLFGNEDTRVTITNLQKFVGSLLDSKLLDGNLPAGFLYYLMMKNKNLNLNLVHNRKIIRTLVDLTETATGRKTLQEIAEGNFRKVFGKLETILENKPDDPESSENLSDIKIHSQDYLTDKDRESTSDIFKESDIFQTVLVDVDSMKFIYRFFINRIWINCFESDKERLESIKIAKIESNHKNEVRRTIAKTFLEEYNGATNLPIPPIKAKNKSNGKPITPWLSQLFTAYKVKTMPHFANFSGTGAGKTLSAIIASKAINAKMTVIVCPNALVQNGQWANEAEQCFDGNYTISGYNAFYEKYDKNKSKFLIINWDKLNQKNKSTELVEILAKQKIDLIVIDEVHFSKNVESLRFQNLGGLITKARKKNSELKILAMTATPIVNELEEGKTQLQLLTGIKYDELKTTPYTSNAIALWEKFTTICIRHKPKFSNIKFVDIDVEAPIPSESELQFLNRNPLAIEQFLTDYRIPEIIKIIKRIKAPAIIYTDYVGAVDELVNHKSITQKLATALDKEEIEYGFYTGKDKSGLPDFIEKKIDVLIASNPLAVGVDELQYRCKHLIFNSLPWTNARYRQIIGRIARPGQGDEIIIYHIRGNFPAKAYDLREKLDKIANKARLADCAVDGENLPEGRLPTHGTAIKNTLDWLKQLRNGEASYITRYDYNVELPKLETVDLKRKHGTFEELNKKYAQNNSKTIYEIAQKNPDFLKYYTSEQIKSERHLTINPTDFLIQKLKEMPENSKICDMGCGLQNKIRKEFGRRVKSFDIGTYDIDELIPCDIADVSHYVKKGSQDIVIFSQSLMSKNWSDMITESSRILRKFGYLIIVVQTQQWRNRIDKLLDVIYENGFELVGEPKTKGEFTFIDSIKYQTNKLKN